MCGRYGASTVEQIANRFKIEIRTTEYRSGLEVFPSQSVPVILQETGLVLDSLKWGLSPVWSKSLLINARRENLMTSKFWKPSIETRRCLVPASAFFEWQTIDGKKVKWKIGLKGSDLFCFAGIYDTVRDKNNNEIVSFAILTEPANPLMKHIHNFGDNKHRQPVIVMDEQYNEWLDTKRPAEKVLDSIGTYSEDLLEAEPEREGLF